MRFVRLALVINLYVCSVATCVFAQLREPAEITPPDVFVHVQLFRAELELVRVEMGRAKSALPAITVLNAAPREVFFQALTLSRKADQLAFEQLRQRSEAPVSPEGEPQPKDVFGAVDHALKSLRAVKRDLNCTEQAQAIERDDRKTPSDVFNAIVQANQQINVLLDRRFSPSNVYQQVTVAVNYASILLSEFPKATRIPRTPDFVPRKQPADVFRRLVGCFESMKKIGDASDVAVLELNVDEQLVPHVESSEVYDLASLLVSELSQMHLQLKNAAPPISSYYPGRKVPAHAYQRAGILEAQLTELQAKVIQNPNWLRGD